MAKGVSLHIGLNAVDPNCYQGWAGQLVACEQDAHDMHAIAESLGYHSQLLLTAAATRKAVTDAIAAAARSLDSSDIFFLTYSGHGGQVPDTNNDEPDHKDETWVLYDGQLIDDQLYELWTRFQPGVRISVLSDSCHSGTVARLYEGIASLESNEGLRKQPSFRSKALPRDIQAAVYAHNREEIEQIQREVSVAIKQPPKASVLLISGCQDTQLSSDGDVNGLFTEHLLEVWNHGAFKSNYRAFCREIVRRMPPSQQPNYFFVGAPNRAFERQHPFVIGAAVSATRS